MFGFKKVAAFALLLVSSLLLSGCNPFVEKKSGLQVITNDIPASIYLDGQYLEKTPYIGKDLKAGQYTLKILPDDSNLVPYETTINLRGGLLTVVTWIPGNRPETSGGVIYEMEKLSNSKHAEISIISLPDQAIVSLDGQNREFTPILIENIEPGHHEFEMSLPSYETQKHTINVVAGHRMDVTVKLAKSIDTNQFDSETAEATPSAEIASDSATSTSKATPSAQTSTSSGVPVRQAVIQNGSGTVTIQSTNYFVNSQEVLKVRSEPNSTGKEIGQASVGKSYPYLNETQAGWYKISFNDQTGWVSGQYATLQE